MFRARGLLYALELSALVVLVRIGLARHGFQRTVERSMTLRPATDRDEAACSGIVSLARTKAHMVFRWHPVANKCLEQSLALCRLLARRGIKAELIIAVRKYPFESHAWARWGEVCLTDPPERNPEQFRVITRF